MWCGGVPLVRSSRPSSPRPGYAPRIRMTLSRMTRGRAGSGSRSTTLARVRASQATYLPRPHGRSHSRGKLRHRGDAKTRGAAHKRGVEAGGGSRSRPKKGQPPAGAYFSIGIGPSVRKSLGRWSSMFQSHCTTMLSRVLVSFCSIFVVLVDRRKC